MVSPNTADDFILQPETYIFHNFIGLHPVVNKVAEKNDPVYLKKTHVLNNPFQRGHISVNV